MEATLCWLNASIYFYTLLVLHGWLQVGFFLLFIYFVLIFAMRFFKKVHFDFVFLYLNLYPKSSVFFSSSSSSSPPPSLLQMFFPFSSMSCAFSDRLWLIYQFDITLPNWKISCCAYIIYLTEFHVIVKFVNICTTLMNVL